ncbi:MAG: exodeoxyribonuclease V subunit alpha, partial [Leptospira sp.]|nr:exodeoxyribonuclease V subunit alpha [Leptospira sp.]
MKNTFITRLSKDIFSLGDKKKVISSSNKQRSSNQESVSIPDPVRIYEEICESLWNSEEEGNLCIDISNHPQKDFLKKNTPGFVSELIENRELLFFEKTYNKKKALENLLRERISSNEKIAIDSRKANEILDNLQTKSFRLKKGQIGAIESGLRSTFQIISGGPGTGK